MRHSKKKIISIFLALTIAISVAIIMPRHNTRADIQPTAQKTEEILVDQVKDLILKEFSRSELSNFSKDQYKGEFEKKYPNLKEELKKAEAQNDPKEQVRLIVQLENAAAVTKAPIKDSKGNENYTKVQAEVNAVKNNQNTIIKQVELITGNKARKSYGYLLNGFSITAKREDIDKIKKISGVAKVSEAKKGYFDMKFAKELTQVYQVWDELNYKGEGMVIAVIDSGIDPSHKDLVLTESGRKAAKLKDTNPQGPGKYFTEKIPYGYNFADFNTEIVDKNIFTYMHGMHVAGIIGANSDKNSEDLLEGIQGVAPEAQLLAMKISSNKHDDQGDIYEDDVIAAIEDSVIHGADIINMSLGWYSGFQDPDNPEQIAIKNATDQGVLVVVAAGNSSVSTMDDIENEHILNKLGVVDTGTVSSPSTAKDAISVASYENSQYANYSERIEKGTNSMSYFSSFGPAPNLGFKPEITAPGGHIYSLANNNEYNTASGTSMAAPHVAGAQALVIQSIKAKNPNIKGRELVELAKNLVINTAEVLVNSDNNLPYSPRRQGAGMIQVKNAINSEVIVTDSKGNAAIELKEIGQTAEVTLTFKNFGNTAATYTLDKSYLMTEETDPNSKVISSVIINGGTISLSQNSITVPAKGKATVKMTIKLPNGFAKQQFVEGFVQLKSENKPTLTVPFIGFYGNWSELDILDKPAWEKDSKSTEFATAYFKELIYGNRDVETIAQIGTTLLGVNESGSTNKLGVYGMDYYDIVRIDPNKIAFSPNGDGVNDSVVPNLFLLRNANEIKVEVLDAKKQVVATVGKESKIRKNILEQEALKLLFYTNSGTTLMDSAWNGNLYDWSTGKSKAAPQGQYYIRITTKADIENAKEQTLEMPVLLDTEAPVMELKSTKVVDNGKYTLQWTSKDNLSGIDEGIIKVVVNDKLNRSAKITKNGDNFSCDIDLEENAFHSIIVYNIDYAGNISEMKVEVQVGKATPVGFDQNLEDGQWVTTDSLNLKGKVTAEVKTLKINDKEVAITESNGFRRFDETIKLQVGDNSIKVTAQDNEGKVIFDKTFNIKSDGEPPTIEIYEPKLEESSAMYGSDFDIVYLNSDVKDVTIKGAVRDNYKLKELTIKNQHVDVNDKGEFEHKLELLGNTYCFIDVVDEAGNTTSKNIFFVTEDPTLASFYVDFYNLYLVTIVNKENSKDGVYILEGKTRGPLKVFKINDKDVQVKDDLTFSFPVELKDGLNVVKVYAENQAGEVISDMGYKILYDVNAPTLNILEPEIKKDGKVYTNQDKLTIKGDVSDNTFGYTFYINGDKVAVTDKYPLLGNEANKKEFTHKIPVKGNGKLTFVADDGLGNSMEAVIDVIQDKVAPGAPTFIYDNKSTSKAVNVEIKANDKDIEVIEFSFDKEKWFVYTEPVKVDANCTIFARVIDYAGNVTYGEVSITNINKNESDNSGGEDKDNNNQDSDKKDGNNHDNNGNKDKGKKDNDQKDNGTAVDENGNPLPKTGSPIDLKVLGIVGGVLILAGGAFVIFGKKRKKSSK